MDAFPHLLHSIPLSILVLADLIGGDLHIKTFNTPFILFVLPFSIENSLTIL
jgi:hypothetical protein